MEVALKQSKVLASKEARRRAAGAISSDGSGGTGAVSWASLAKGQKLAGTVRRVTDFGVFVKLHDSGEELVTGMGC